MDKNSITTIIMMVLLIPLIYFGMKMFGSNGGKGEKVDNFVEMNFSEKGDSIFQKSLKGNQSSKIISGESNLVEFKFDTEGAVITSYRIKSKNSEIEPVELVLTNDDGNKPFSLFWGNDRRNPDRSIYSSEEIINDGKYIYIFKANFLDNNNKPFSLIKKFELVDDEYLFKLSVEITTADNSRPAIGKNGYAYSIYYGPQLGPIYSTLAKKKGRYKEERIINEYYNDKIKILNRSDIYKNRKITDSGIEYYVEPLRKKDIKWIALSGRYFMFVSDIPSNVRHLYYASDSVESDSESEFNMIYENEFFFAVNELNDSDPLLTEFYFYLGPKVKEAVSIYNTGENRFGRNDLNFNKLVKSGFFGLSNLVKKAIAFINRFVKNWGFSIIVFTIILKLLLFGLTKKSYESTSKMQKLAPQINELKEKYKDKPQELNAATAALYKAEGANPMMGCLPMLLQFPILIAIYQFINNSYELRGENFMLWINDLSAPDALFAFSKDLPFLHWSTFNLLPFLYIATQMLSTWIMQPKKDKEHKNSKAGAQQAQMKFMQYGLPLMFFFLLYGAPSGLFVYWITMNLVTTLQQSLYNKFYKGKKGSGGLTKKLLALIKTKKA